MTPHPPTPITYRHRHAFTTAEQIIQTGDFYLQEAQWFAGIGEADDDVHTEISYTSFIGHAAHSGFCEDGNYWIEGTMICDVTCRDQWGRHLTGTFINVRFCFLFPNDGTYPTIFKWRTP